MDVVLDTNVAVSGAISPKGPPAEIIRSWRAQSFSWVTSDPLLEELERTFRSRRIRRYLAWSEDELSEFLTHVRRAARVVTPTERIDVMKADPADNRVLEAALAGGAEYIVTGDKALLSLETCEGVPIITPVRFLAVLQSALPQG